MGSIFDQYGVKEVSDVVFYALNKTTDKIDYKNPVLFLDSLKVSTVEQTAENVAARGGKGNPELVVWDYNKEITVTLEDALFSTKSLQMMFGVQKANIGKKNSSNQCAFTEAEGKQMYRVVKSSEILMKAYNFTFSNISCHKAKLDKKNQITSVAGAEEKVGLFIQKNANWNSKPSSIQLRIPSGTDTYATAKVIKGFTADGKMESFNWTEAPGTNYTCLFTLDDMTPSEVSSFHINASENWISPLSDLEKYIKNIFLDRYVYFIVEMLETDSSDKTEYIFNGTQYYNIDIDAYHFPGYYAIVGDTYVRARKAGNDEFFQFIIYKAKMSSEVSFTLEAEGDPATFTMTMKAVKPTYSNTMMSLIKYKLKDISGASTAAVVDGTLINQATLNNTIVPPPSDGASTDSVVIASLTKDQQTGAYIISTDYDDYVASGPNGEDGKWVNMVLNLDVEDITETQINGVTVTENQYDIENQNIILWIDLAILKDKESETLTITNDNVQENITVIFRNEESTLEIP